MAGIKQIRPNPRTTTIAKQDIWLTDILDEYLAGTMSAPRKGVFYPSSLVNPCYRYLWLAYHGKLVDTPLPAITQRIFQCGSSLEDRVAKWFDGLGILRGQEVPLKTDIPPISGRIDFIINHYEFGVMPVELKSINKSNFGKLKTAKPEHEMQLQMYLNMGNYDKGTVLYECKDDQKLKSFIIERDVIEWDNILKRCFNIQEMLVRPEKCTGASWCACKNIGEE